ncbi:MAG: chain-length determining protein [Muribaculaceae bacterium]|nr:chain-length determining protein [Muribaculaceae bacterium]
MQEDKNLIEKEGEEKEIDIMEMAMKLWEQRKRIIKWCVIGAVIGVMVAFSIPREYETIVKLAPELPDTKASSGGLSALASMAGLNSNMLAGRDAVNPMLYPDVVQSVPFLTGLFNVEVTTKKDKEQFTVEQYMEDETSGTWWGYILGLPFKLFGLLIPSDDEIGEDHALNSFQLTKKECDMVKALSKRITASFDEKTYVITISVMMQDPLVSAMLADTVVTRLQEYITDYRTNKARVDLAYAEKLNEEARVEYYEAQQRYADYLDRNQGLAFRSAEIVRERLQNEAQLAYSLYNQTAQHLQKAQAKVQEATPAYAVISPATVPIKPAKPKKVMILIGFTFLAFVACAAWILFLSPMLDDYKSKMSQVKQENGNNDKNH